MDYLVKHALENVWCSPRQDRQFRMRPKRISKDVGEYIKIEDNWISLALPDKKHFWHVYQIGQLHPDFLGLFPVQNRWVSMTEVCNRMGMIAELYTTKGILIPKFNTYYMVTETKNLIITTLADDRILGIDFSKEDIWFRVYTNSFFQSVRSNEYVDRIVTDGKQIVNTNDILNLQSILGIWKNKDKGFAYAIINGLYMDNINPFTCKVGDYVEFVYDSSVDKVVDFAIKDLPDFESELDQERKYLLHYESKGSRIEYQDDVDFFIVDKPDNGYTNGLYHHKNSVKSMRMVTHKDYSVSVQLINSFVDGHKEWNDPQKLHLRLLIRNSGWDRKLQFEHHRIHELYKLDEKDFLPALVGDNAAVSVWRASKLESAQYSALMRSGRGNVDLEMVKNAYGYNACSKLLGDTPQLVYEKNGNRVVSVPHGLYASSTMYEYRDGVLLGWYYHSNGSKYITRNRGCDLVEGISGKVSRELDEYHNPKTVVIDPKYNYRVYVSDLANKVPQGNWTDVTDSGMYSIIDGVLTWVGDVSTKYTVVRSDKQNFGYVEKLYVNDGKLEFDLIQYRIHNGTYISHKLFIPLGELDIWLNGKSLIEKIDYVVKGNKVIIFNKKYLINPETDSQSVAIRYCGFCKKNLEREQKEDVGYVKYELISRNASFGIRDDRVLRIVVDGKVKHRNQLKFSEEDEFVMIPHAMNGDPYSIRDIVVPMRCCTDKDTYQFREESRLIDKEISDYLTIKLPEPVPAGPNVIDELYPVYSPFLCKIMHDLINGAIDTNLIKDSYGASVVRDICNPYLYLLEFDPTQNGNLYNPDYVIVHPHYSYRVLDIDIYHYTFLQRCIDLYMPGKVVLNHWLRLKEIP